MAQNPVFTIKMRNGKEMKGELYPEVAPQSVGNFIALANSGFYDGLIFHRVIPGFMIQEIPGVWASAVPATASRASSPPTAYKTR